MARVTAGSTAKTAEGSGAAVFGRPVLNKDKNIFYSCNPAHRVQGSGDVADEQ